MQYSETANDAIWQWLSNAFPGMPVVFGDQSAPAPAAPYCAIFPQRRGGAFLDTVEQMDADNALQTGDRELDVELRFIGAGSMNAAEKVETICNGEETPPELEEIGAAIFEAGEARQTTAISPGGNDFLDAAAYSFSVRYPVEVVFARDSVETATIRGEINGKPVEINS